MQIFELHLSNTKSLAEKFRFRIETSSAKKQRNVQHLYSNSGLDIYYIYKQYLTPYLNEKQFTLNLDLPESVVGFQQGSKMLQKFNWKSKMNRKLSLSKETRHLIGTIWSRAVGELSDVFKFSEEDLFSVVTFDMLTKSEGILHKQKEALETKNSNETVDYSAEFWSSLPFLDSVKSRKISDKKNLFMFFEIIQVIRDILSISESTDWNLRASILSKYR